MIFLEQGIQRISDGVFSMTKNYIAKIINNIHKS